MTLLYTRQQVHCAIGRFLLGLITVTLSLHCGAQSITARVETAIVLADSIDSWQSKGVGLTRGEENGVALRQSFIAGSYAISSNWQAKAVLNAYTDGEKHIGFTQAYLHYKPLSPNKVKFAAKFGMFYPEMSIENTSEGWLSPYTYTQSAINSWIGEELRTIGAQASWTSNGRQRRSPWSWEGHVGLFKGNDPLGTLLTWRGFAMHDRQTLHNDKVEFAPIPSIINFSTAGSPTWLDPFTEVDGRWGAYVGLHLRYLRKTDIRHYYYDNRANPEAINKDRLYGWHTKFHSFALQHQLDANWRLMAQILEGSTVMGDRGVYAGIFAAYTAASYASGKHRTTLRIDYHVVDERDFKYHDPNDSRGFGVTLAWRYQLSPALEIGAETHQHNSSVDNRALVNVAVKQAQTQGLLVLAFAF